MIRHTSRRRCASCDISRRGNEELFSDNDVWKGSEMTKQDKEQKSDWRGAIIVVFLAAAIIGVGGYLYLRTEQGQLSMRMA